LQSRRSRRGEPIIDAATRNRLIGEGATEETADAWIAAWEVQAAQDELGRGADYWDAGWDWIAGQRNVRKAPE
jgi:hypothetical protein